jgi:cobalt-zinc-cadmium efflux system membrane fusion protein
LGGVALWGHLSGWTLPKFSAWIGNGQTADDDWCKEHSVPEAICVECKEALMPRIAVAWCKEHGVHYCPFENPQVIQVKGAVAIAPDDLERARRALALKERPANTEDCKKILRRIQFSSVAAMNRLGLVLEKVKRAPVEETISANGEITYEQPRVTTLSVPVLGRVLEVTAKGQMGQHVSKGDVLAVVDAADVGKVKTELLQALAQVDLRSKTLENLRLLAADNLVSATRLREAEAELREAQIRQLAAQQALINMGLPVRVEELAGLSTEQLFERIRFLGIPPEIAKGLDPRATTANLLPVRAARDGVVTSVRAAVGDLVDPTKTLFVVVDTSRMWLTLNVRLEDKKYLRIRDPKTGAPGQTVRFLPDGGERPVEGELVWMSSAVDDTTRRFQVRADLPNPDGGLTAHTFGTGAIFLRVEKDAIVVPSEAVHWEGDCHVVFVQDKNFHDPGAPKVFHVRAVRPGVRSGDYTEIIAGVVPGEWIATKNSASLRAELLKGSLGEG